MKKVKYHLGDVKKTPEETWYPIKEVITYEIFGFQLPIEPVTITVENFTNKEHAEMCVNELNGE